MKTLGILVSGRGSNMVALLEGVRSGFIPGEVGIVVSNKPSAPALDKARSFDVPTAVVPQKEFRGKDREEHDRAVNDVLEQAGVDVICLAGYMRILSPWLVGRYANRIVNIHPSLLPAFPGLHGQRQALEYGVRVTGCTVHLVDAELDHGPILAQAAVPVLADDSEESLSARILEQEHRIYPLAVRWLCQDRVELDGRRVRIRDEHLAEPWSALSPADIS
jgi:phosphoribosylglycinamide formyltransferase-1